MKTSRGFTILEILAVIAVISALSLITIPVYRQIAPTLKLNSTTRDIASDLRYAQQLAVAEQVVYQVVFNIAQNKYSIINNASGQIIKSKTIDPKILIQTIDETLTDDTVNFNVTGASVESGSIILLNENNNTSTIEIKPSGYVKIE